MENRSQFFILGHSIVRRFSDFAKHGADVRYKPSLGLERSFNIHYRGVGGRKALDILRRDAFFIEQVRPRFIVLMIGGNDVNSEKSPEELASEI